MFKYVIKFKNWILGRRTIQLTDCEGDIYYTSERIDKWGRKWAYVFDTFFPDIQEQVGLFFLKEDGKIVVINNASYITSWKYI
jgi:hypothetical protein